MYRSCVGFDSCRHNIDNTAIAVLGTSAKHSVYMQVKEGYMLFKGRTVCVHKLDCFDLCTGGTADYSVWGGLVKLLLDKHMQRTKVFVLPVER